jgi:hypothetical protein
MRFTMPHRRLSSMRMTLKRVGQWMDDVLLEHLVCCSENDVILFENEGRIDVVTIDVIDAARQDVMADDSVIDAVEKEQVAITSDLSDTTDSEEEVEERVAITSDLSDTTDSEEEEEEELEEVPNTSHDTSDQVVEDDAASAVPVSIIDIVASTAITGHEVTALPRASTAPTGSSRILPPVASRPQLRHSASAPPPATSSSAWRLQLANVAPRVNSHRRASLDSTTRASHAADWEEKQARIRKKNVVLRRQLERTQPLLYEHAHDDAYTKRLVDAHERKRVVSAKEAKAKLKPRWK